MCLDMEEMLGNCAPNPQSSLGKLQLQLIDSESSPFNSSPLYAQSGLEGKMLRCSIWMALVNHIEFRKES